MIEYLEREWTDREIKRFITAVNDKLGLIAIYPELFVITNKRKNIHKTMINKQVILFYRNHKAANRIELLLFWDGRRDPATFNL